MPVGILNLEWLDHNSQRNYPLKGDVTPIDLTETLTIPEDLLVGLQLSVDFALNVDPSKFYIYKLSSFTAGLQLTIGYDSATGPVAVATAVVSKTSHVKYNTYSLAGTGDFSNCRGFVVIGSFDSLDEQPSGDFEFDPTATSLETDTIRPAINGVASLRVRNGLETSNKITGHVIFRAGRNFRFRVAQVPGEPTVITFDAEDGAGLTEDCVCSDNLQPPIRTVQGVPGDSQANLQLYGNECLEFEAINNGVRANDTCSSPCCGCKELEAVTQTLESFGSRATTLENFLVGLEARVSAMDLTVLGSRLGDRGCAPAANC